MGALDTNADKGVDVEEATVAEFLIGSAPVGETIVLLVEKVVEGVVVGVQFADDLIDCGGGFGLFFAEAVEETEDDFFVAMADLHAFNVGAVGERKTREAVCEEAQCGAIHGFACALENDRQGARSERINVVHVANADEFVVALDLDLAGSEDFAVLIAEDGNEDFVLKADFRRVPVDVEPRGKAA